MISDLKLISISFLIVSLLLGYSGCKDSLQRDDIPRLYVREEINLNDFNNSALNNINGYVYINGGVRGIIIYRKSVDEYDAFERDCPYQPNDSCALVSVDNSTLFMIDTCCSSRFDFDGNPIAGPARFPLLQHNVYRNQNYLIISSE